MVAARINFRAVQFSCRPPCHQQSVRPFFNARAHAPQVLRHRRNSIALFHAQLGCIVDLDALFCERPQRREHRQLVNQLRHRRTFDHAALERGVAHGNVAHQFSARSMHGN